MKNLLTDDMKKWLYFHYPNMSNEKLAAELTEMVNKRNAKRLTELHSLLEVVTLARVVRDIKKEIRSIENFKPFNSNSIKQHAYKLKCPPKTRRHISQSNREKAHHTNVKKWIQHAIVLELTPFEYLNTFRSGDTQVVKFSTSQQMLSFKTSVWKFNNKYGKGRGIYILATQIDCLLYLRIEARVDICG